MSKLPAETSSAASSKSVTDLLSEDYNYYLFEQLMATEKDFNLEHFEFVEVILSWIKANRPSHAKITKLWELIRQKDLSYHYLYRVHGSIVYTKNYNIPQVVKLEDSAYKYSETGCLYYHARSMTIPLFNEHPAIFHYQCQKCPGNVERQITLRLCDNRPCYTAVTDDKHTVNHCYIRFNTNNKSESLKPRHHFGFLSLITSNMNDARTVINGVRQSIGIYFLYECNLI